MHPQRKFSITLVLSLVLWYPTMHAQLGGGAIGVPEMCARYLLCFFVAKVLVGVVANLYDSYAAAIARAEAEAQAAEEEAAAEREAAEAEERANRAAETIFGSE